MSTDALSGHHCKARFQLPHRKILSACNRASQEVSQGKRMRHLKSGSKLGRNPWHRRATLRNLVTNLLEHGRITTTVTRAKAARPVAEKMITLGKRDTLQSRRQAASYIM